MRALTGIVIAIAALALGLFIGHGLPDRNAEAPAEAAPPRKALIVDTIPYAPQWERAKLWAAAIEAGEPDYLAARAIAAGDFRLLADKHAISRASAPGAACTLALPAAGQAIKTYPDGLLEVSNASWVFTPEGENGVETPPSNGGASAFDFATSYNVRIVSAADYPYTDICQPDPEAQTDMFERLGTDFEGWFFIPKEGLLIVEPAKIAALARPKTIPNVPPQSLPAAARLGDITAVERFLRAGEAADGIDVWGMTPLAWAAIRGHREIAELLLQFGAAVERPAGFDQRTPLVWAAYGGNARLVGLLLDNGAIPDGSRLSRLNETPLAAAALAGHVAAIETLLAAGADPDAVGEATFGAGKPGPGVGLLVPPLIAAAYAEQGEAVKILVELGADPNIEPPNALRTITPLYVAAGGSDTDMVRWLAAHGADLNLLGSDGDHPALDGAYRKSDMIRLLISLGADPNAGADKRRRNYRGTVSPLGTAAGATGNDAAVLALLEAGADAAEPQALRRTVLRDALRALDISTVEALIAAGARADTVDVWGDPTWFSPCRHGPEELAGVLNLLKRAGLDMNAVDRDGGTILFDMCLKPEAVSVLVAAGANPNARDRAGRTALFGAYHSGKDDLVAALIAAGADETARDAFGNLYTDYDRQSEDPDDDE